jgi:uncharacterized protein YciI
MYIISLTYKVSLEEVDRYLEEHIEYLNRQYEMGNFLASGRKVPRTGGIILSNVPDKDKLSQILEEDPFKKNELAEYEIIEFIPVKTCEELKFLMN